jgi:hypothetical protein
VRVDDTQSVASGRLVPLPSSWRSGVAFLDSLEGTWRLPGDFSAGELLRVEIRAEGHAPAIADAVETAIDPDPDAFIVRLARRTHVLGRVLDAHSGVALQGARVRSFRHESELHGIEPAPETRTDDAGRFELSDLPTGETRLAVEHEDRALVLDGPFVVTGSAPVERRILLGRGARIHGRLLDRSGAGLGGETIEAWGLEVAGETQSWSATTGEDGSYELSKLPPGTYHLYWSRRREGVRANDLLRLVQLERDEALAVDLAPEGRAIVRGRIEFEGSLPELLAVRFLPEDRPNPDEDPQAIRWARRARATFAEHGRFELHDLEAGRHLARVYFELPGEKSANPFLPAHASGSSGYFEVPEEGSVDIVIVARRSR